MSITGSTTLDEIKQRVANMLNSINEGVKTMVSDLDTLTSDTIGSMGTTRESVRALGIQFANALPSVAAMGGELKNIAAIQQGVGTELGRNNVLTADVVSKLFAAQEAIGLSSSQLSKSVGEFQDAGISSGVVAKNMEAAANFSRQMGVNTKVAFDLMTDNLNKLNEFGFESGIDGLARMATTAASMRVTMTGVFNMAERAFNPEGAIEMVSAFQRLGVVAGDLADPFRLLYLAQNDTEELQNQVVQMTEKFTYFDEKSKTFKVFPNAKQDLRDLASATNMGYEDLVKYSIGAQKLKEIGKDIRIGGIDEETKKFIANMAEFDEKQGGFAVTLTTGETRLVTELNSEDVKKIQPKPETLEDIAKSQLGFDKNIDSNIAAIKAKIVSGIATSGPAMDIVETSRAIARGVLETAGTAVPSVQDTRRGTERVVGSISGAAEKMITGEFNISDVMKGISTMTTDIGETLKRSLESIDFNKALNIAGKEISPNNELINSINRLTDKIDMGPIPNRTTATPTGASPAVFEVKPITQTTNVKFDQLSLNVNGTIKLEGNGMNSDIIASQFFANNGQYRGQLEKIIQDTIKNMKQPTYTAIPSTA
jgi:hypothetical protein